jgi:hypothetical protein
VYYAAASVVVIALSAFFFLQQSQRRQPIIAAAPAGGQPFKAETAIEKQGSVNDKKRTTVKKNDHIAIVKYDRVPVDKQAIVTVETPVETKDLAAEIELPSPVKPLELEKKTATRKNVIPVMAKAKPKLKIIYLNELGVMPLPEPLSKQEIKQMVQQQQADQQETAPLRDPVKHILYIKTLPRTTTATSLNNQ